MGLLGFFVACLLFVSPVLALFSVAIRRKSGRGIAWTGLVLAILCATIVLPVRLITYTPAGSVPNVFREYKFRKACPCGFWLDFDKKHMTDVQSQYMIILVKFGTVRFESDPNTYNRQKVIDYAEQNGWVYKCSVSLTNEDFKKFNKKMYEDWDPVGDILICIGFQNRSPFWIETDCELLAFDTGSRLGTASFVMLSKDGGEMVVRYSDPLLPDGPHDFLLPPSFYEETVGTEWKNNE